MHTLLPCYPEMSAKFNQGKREGHHFDALELFVRHFLREGSIFACFGFERLYEQQVLTELHFHDIHNQNRSISEDLDLLDKAIEEFSKDDIHESNQTFSFIEEPFLFQLQAAIKQRDLSAVCNVLATNQGFVDAKTLCLAIRYYERAIFLLLLEHGAQVDGDDFTAGPLYHAAKTDHMEAVQLLLFHGAQIEGKCSCINATPMNGAASGGHLEIVQYLFEKKGANINGNGYKSPLSCAIKHRHAHIVDYLLRAGAIILQEDYLELLSQFVVNKKMIYGDFLEHSIACMGNDARESLRYRAHSEGYFEIVRYLLGPDAHGSSDTANLEQNSWPQETVELGGQFHTTSSLFGIYNFQTRWYEDSKQVDGPVGSNMLFEELSKSIGSRLPGRCELSSGWLGGCEWNEIWNAESETESLELHKQSIEDHCHSSEDFKGSRDSADSKGLKGFEASKAIDLKPTEPDLFSLDAYVHDYMLRRTQAQYNSSNFVHTMGTRMPHSANESPSSPPRDDQGSKAIDVENCPTVAAIQTQNRKIMTRQLIAEIANSCEKLLDAGTKTGASANFKAFLGRVGTRFSIWRRGTRAIRDLCEGYMPHSLSDIVSALQVSDAMRSVVPPSQLRCSKKE
jgi:ankyrin repeat protein